MLSLVASVYVGHTGERYSCAVRAAAALDDEGGGGSECAPRRWGTWIPQPPYCIHVHQIISPPLSCVAPAPLCHLNRREWEVSPLLPSLPSWLSLLQHAECQREREWKQHEKAYAKATTMEVLREYLRQSVKYIVRNYSPDIPGVRCFDREWHKCVSCIIISANAARTRQTTKCKKK